MGISCVLVAVVLAFLAVERISIVALTRREAGRQWVIDHRILHPNTISLVRIPMGVLSVVTWLLGWQAFSIVWFAVWMITDLTDGTIARNCDLTTESGKWLDPLSDKCMYFPPLVLFACLGVLDPAWVAAVIVTDAVGQASRLLVKKKAANLFGKAKTALITVLLSLTALDQIGELAFISPAFLYLLTISCAVLAFFSFYCKVVPDVWYANSLSLANFFCGLAAIVSVASGHLVRAYVWVFLGQFLDLFDGRLARKYGSTRHGAVYDDIADGTSFGLAIGYLIFSRLGGGVAAGVAAGAYVLCVVYRLFRFLHPPVPLPRGIFLGLPSPAGALLGGAAVLLFYRWPPIAYGLVALTSFLMVSRIRYRHFGQLIWPKLPRSLKVLAFVLFVVFVNKSLASESYVAFELWCLGIAVLYTGVYGVDWDWVRSLREGGGSEGGPAEDGLGAEPEDAGSDKADA